MKRVPIGIENFQEMCTSDYYYIDKTAFLEELLCSGEKVALFTRPRRFGKSLMMNMLKCFLEIGADRSLFEGFAIMQRPDLIQKHLGAYPVISMTFKRVEGRSFDDMIRSLCTLIRREASRFSYLEESEKLTADERALYLRIKRISFETSGLEVYEDIISSLKNLSDLLCKHHMQQVVILLDEYDVPLDKSYYNGYYEEALAILRGLFADALKTNDSLEFAVLTGCLRISKESIFTGLNNFAVHSISDEKYASYFGFTESEVQEMFHYYQIEDKLPDAKDWYNGYEFGSTALYCPWDVLNYCNALRTNLQTPPYSYWDNTSGNELIRLLLKQATYETKTQVNCLINGTPLQKKINENLTYAELDQSIENIWSALYATGYLTKRGPISHRMYTLTIPNKEIHELFQEKIVKWLEEEMRTDFRLQQELLDAFETGDTECIEEYLQEHFFSVFGQQDMKSKSKKENFYHGVLLGILRTIKTWEVLSNPETGDGYADLVLIDKKKKTGYIIEVKYGEKGKLDKACSTALAQIKERDYTEILRDRRIKNVLFYGIGVHFKTCRILCESSTIS